MQVMDCIAAFRSPHPTSTQARVPASVRYTTDLGRHADKVTGSHTENLTQRIRQNALVARLPGLLSFARSFGRADQRPHRTAQHTQLATAAAAADTQASDGDQGRAQVLCADGGAGPRHDGSHATRDSKQHGRWGAAAPQNAARCSRWWLFCSACWSMRHQSFFGSAVRDAAVRGSCMAALLLAPTGILLASLPLSSSRVTHHARRRPHRCMHPRDGDGRRSAHELDRQRRRLHVGRSRGKLSCCLRGSAQECCRPCTACRGWQPARPCHEPLDAHAHTRALPLAGARHRHRAPRGAALRAAGRLGDRVSVPVHVSGDRNEARPRGDDQSSRRFRRIRICKGLRACLRTLCVCVVSSLLVRPLSAQFFSDSFRALVQMLAELSCECCVGSVAASEGDDEIRCAAAPLRACSAMHVAHRRARSICHMRAGFFFLTADMKRTFRIDVALRSQFYKRHEEY